MHSSMLTRPLLKKASTREEHTVLRLSAGILRDNLNGADVSTTGGCHLRHSQTAILPQSARSMRSCKGHCGWILTSSATACATIPPCAWDRPQSALTRIKERKFTTIKEQNTGKVELVLITVAGLLCQIKQRDTLGVKHN